MTQKKDRRQEHMYMLTVTQAGYIRACGRIEGTVIVENVEKEAKTEQQTRQVSNDCLLASITYWKNDKHSMYEVHESLCRRRTS